MVEELRMLLDLLIAAILGFVIGYERKLRLKEAGIRTHTIVCVGAALMMIISKYGFIDVGAGDPGRIAAQIVAGVGFLGAGMIVYKKQEVHGLTTAAGIWAAAGVGMACGARMYIIAVGATTLLVVAQLIFHSKVKIFHTKRTYSVNIHFEQTDNENLIIKELFNVDRFNHLVIKREDGKTFFSAVLNTDIEYRSSELNEIMAKHPFIISIERCDND